MSMHKTNNRHNSWIGNREMCLDEISVKQYGDIMLGKYGGNISAGAKKNEDGALVWSNGDWEFAAILDGHNSAESVDLVVNTIQKEYEHIKVMMNQSIDTVFRSVEIIYLQSFNPLHLKKSAKALKVKQLA